MCCKTVRAQSKCKLYFRVNIELLYINHISEIKGYMTYAKYDKIILINLRFLSKIITKLIIKLKLPGLRICAVFYFHLVVDKNERK